jgi:hypothetical protein
MVQLVMVGEESLQQIPPPPGEAATPFMTVKPEIVVVSPMPEQDITPDV